MYSCLLQEHCEGWLYILFPPFILLSTSSSIRSFIILFISFISCCPLHHHNHHHYLSILLSIHPTTQCPSCRLPFPAPPLSTPLHYYQPHRMWTNEVIVTESCLPLCPAAPLALHTKRREGPGRKTYEKAGCGYLSEGWLAGWLAVWLVWCLAGELTDVKSGWLAQQVVLEMTVIFSRK